jgi:hypothetical protein
MRFLYINLNSFKEFRNFDDAQYNNSLEVGDKASFSQEKALQDAYCSPTPTTQPTSQINMIWPLWAHKLAILKLDLEETQNTKKSRPLFLVSKNLANNSPIAKAK